MTIIMEISFILIWLTWQIAFIIEDIRTYYSALHTWDKPTANARMKAKLKATGLKSLLISIGLSIGVWLIAWLIYFAVIGILHTSF